MFNFGHQAGDPVGSLPGGFFISFIFLLTPGIVIMKKVWLITGCSTGFGRALAKEVLAKGYNVAVAARNTDDIKDIIAGYPETSLAVKLDVTIPEEIAAAVKSTVERFGQVDVLVNNAGIGYFAAIEESEEEQVRRMFEINVFGLAKMTQAVLPVMRKQRSGHILNIASIGGLRAFPGIGFYNATKFAVDGFSESLSKEVAPLGIKVTIIAPSGFRTDWAGRSAKDTTVKIADYETTAGKNAGDIRNYSGNQPGDPVRAAKAMIAITETPEPPLRLLLGAAALKGARIKLEELKKDFDTWAETTEGADFPAENK
jgi:NAD(P)-dependent dehydrogenase (short-subunit alcohol dehydrogenase family)